MPGIEIHNTCDCRVYDIRQQGQGSIDLCGEINYGLSSKPPSLPSLLLWNEEGLRRFDKFAHTPSYYLHDKELEILQRRSCEIAAVVPTGSILVELGCGSLQKTGQLLRALEKQGKSIRYYALDVSLQGLTSSVGQLYKELSNPSLVEIIGLWGTYDDCVSWISTPSGQDPVETSTITFLWMGNSISNMEKPSDASALLSKFKQASEAFSLRSQFLIAADACEDADMVQDAYDCQTAALKAFILNGLSHVNDLMGDTVFHLEDWSCESEFDPEKSQLEVYYTPLRDVTVNGADGETYHFSKGHRIRAICSGKWGRKLMFEVASAAGLQMNHAWGDCAGLYYFYHLYAGV